MTRYKASWPSRILDVLETESVWMDAQQLHVEMLMRFGFVSMATCQRAIERLVEHNDVDKRTVDLPTGHDRFHPTKREIHTLIREELEWE